MNGTFGAAPERLQDETFELIVIGGGIHGVAATLAAARSGHRVLLLEREDFGGATSWNSMRILHGGLRYLQTLDLTRYRESVRARAWFIREFPGLIDPLPCLMPLYDRGMRRRITLGPALALDARLRDRWSTPDARAMLPDGRLLSRDEVRERFPSARTDGLRGGAFWTDALLARPQRVLAEMIRRAACRGADCVNYLEVTSWTTSGGRVAAVRGRDTLNFREYEFRTRAILNCAGPWAAALAAHDDPGLSDVYHPSLAFNVLLDRPLDSSVSVAVESPRGGPTYFLHPMDEMTMAGTVHAPGRDAAAEPSEEQVDRFLGELGEAIPAFRADMGDVLRVMWGTLPARGVDTAATLDRDLLHDASDADGPDGLHSLVGVKYTTAPTVAAVAAAHALGETVRGVPDDADGVEEPATRDVPGWTAFGLWADRDPEAAGALVDALVAEEKVRQPDDLLLRRTDWGLDPRERNLAEARVRQLRPRLFSDAS